MKNGKNGKEKRSSSKRILKQLLKSFGTSYRDVQRDGGITKVGNSYVAIIPTNTRDFGSNLLNNVRVVRLVPCDPSQPMELTKNIRDISGTKNGMFLMLSILMMFIYRLVEQPKAPMEQEYLMPRRLDYKDVNPLLDASQEFAQKVGADYMMNARNSPAAGTLQNPLFWDIEAFDKLTLAQKDAVIKAYGRSLKNSNMNTRDQPLAPSIIPQQDAVLSTLQYAFGLYDPNKTRKGGQTKELEKAMLNTIGNSIRRGDTSGRVDAGADYYGEVENIPAQALLNNYGYSITDKGIVVDDRFNLGSRDDGKTPYTNIGGAFADNPLGFLLNPAAQFTADRLVDLGDTVSKNIKGIDPRDDARAGFPVQYVIPWSRVPANHPAWKLRKKKKKKEEEGKGVDG